MSSGGIPATAGELGLRVPVPGNAGTERTLEVTFMPRKAAAAVVEAEPEVEVVEVIEVVVVEFDEEACRNRAYEISQSEEAGSPEENWLRAEQELRGAAAGADA
jgi:hypothetical protein